MDFWGQVWKRVWEMAFYGLKLGLDKRKFSLGLDLEMPAAHPHQKFQRVPPPPPVPGPALLIAHFSTSECFCEFACTLISLVLLSFFTRELFYFFFFLQVFCWSESWRRAASLFLENHAVGKKAKQSKRTSVTVSVTCGRQCREPANAVSW